MTVVKWKAGRYLKTVNLEEADGRLYIKFGFNRVLINEVRSMKDRKWHGFDTPPIKCWSVPYPLSHRNRWVFDFLDKDKPNPYKKYYDFTKQSTIEINTKRNLFPHQKTMIAHLLSVGQALWASDMGTGKSLAFIESAEQAGLKTSNEIWYIGPKAGVRAVDRELTKWAANISPKMLTYDGLVKVLKHWEAGTEPPKFVCFDECQKIKTPNAQRSKAAMHLTDAMRTEYGNDLIYIVGMSGTPSPKSPVDWWHQIEVIQPGYLREGSIFEFKRTLALTEEKESPLTGQTYVDIVTWLDDENKCRYCGRYKNDEYHTQKKCLNFEKSVNEVKRLHRRLKGLTLVFLKKEVLPSLPDKIYDIIKLKPEVDTILLLKTLKNTIGSAVKLLEKSREISDGFMYKELPTGNQIICPNCKGKTEVEVPDFESEPNSGQIPDDFELKMITVTCPTCHGSGQIDEYKRGIVEVPTPKDDYITNQLTAMSDIGRLIIWAGFTASIDKLVRLTRKYGWACLRIDGRGYFGFDENGNQIDENELLTAMDRSHHLFNPYLQKYPRVCVVGNPEAGGMALTLTAASLMIYYSNSFKGEARMQSEDRGHRIGMDENKGLQIIDLYHLPTDELVRRNVMEKKRLQDITMGDIEKCLIDYEEGK
jgi:hypothetical protein